MALLIACRARALCVRSLRSAATSPWLSRMPLSAGLAQLLSPRMDRVLKPLQSNVSSAFFSALPKTLEVRDMLRASQSNSLTFRIPRDEFPILSATPLLRRLETESGRAAFLLWFSGGWKQKRVRFQIFGTVFQLWKQSSGCRIGGHSIAPKTSSANAASASP